MGSLLRSSPLFSLLNSSTSHSMMAWSKSSPPKCVSPSVESTSRPSPSSRMLTGPRPSRRPQFSDRSTSCPIRRPKRLRWLVDDALHLEAGNFSGFFRGLTLAVVEVGGNGDDRTGDFLTEVLLRRALHLLKRHGGNFLRRVLTVVNLHAGRVVVALDHVVGRASSFLLHFAEVGSHSA